MSIKEKVRLMLDTLDQKLEPSVLESDENEIIRVVLNDEKEGMFLCPTCKERFIKDLSKVANIQKANRIKCKCQCGHVFRAMIERRQSFRKSVELVGACLYSDENGNARRQEIKIHDISMTGLQVSTNNSPRFKVGDTVLVDFRLDDRERTEIQESVTVLRIQSKMVGLKFEDKGLIGKLGLYLMG